MFGEWVNLSSVFAGDQASSIQRSWGSREAEYSDGRGLALAACGDLMEDVPGAARRFVQPEWEGVYPKV